MALSISHSLALWHCCPACCKTSFADWSNEKVEVGNNPARKTQHEDYMLSMADSDPEISELAE